MTTPAHYAAMTSEVREARRLRPADRVLSFDEFTRLEERRRALEMRLRRVPVERLWVNFDFEWPDDAP